jgi:hypothetical protein
VRNGTLLEGFPEGRVWIEQEDAIPLVGSTAVCNRCPATVYDDLLIVMTHLDAVTAGQAFPDEGLYC